VELCWQRRQGSRRRCLARTAWAHLALRLALVLARDLGIVIEVLVVRRRIIDERHPWQGIAFLVGDGGALRCAAALGQAALVS
jgi:hypothetical protein